MEGRVPDTREAIRRMQPYAWEPPSARVALEAGVPEEQVVRFDTNTFPWPGADLDQLAPLDVNEYPDTSYSELTAAITDYTGIPADRITVGAGADEILDLLAKAYIGPDAPTVQSRPTYAMFRIVSEIAGGRVIDVPARDLALDREGFLKQATSTRFIWICNPNNPTGELLPADFIEKTLRAATTAVVAVDEAYFEVSGVTVAALIDRYPNLVVVRTLSKAFGLAGMRVGYALAGDAITAALRRVRPPGSISVISEALAVRSLHDLEGMRERVNQVVAARGNLAAELVELGLNPLPSAANFLLVRTGPELGPALLRQGLVVRTFPRNSPLAEYIRITVRKPEENSRLVQALTAIAPPRAQTRL